MSEPELKAPRREVSSPVIEVFMPENTTVFPGERAHLNLKVGFDFPKQQCGLIQLRASVVKRYNVSMPPMIVGE
jgi:hypothetical protein